MEAPLYTNLLGVIGLYTDYNSTLELITLTKDTVKQLANSDDYFWRRKVLTELKEFRKDVVIKNWATLYQTVTNNYYGTLYRESDGTTQWKSILNNVIKTFEDVAITTHGLYLLVPYKKPLFLCKDDYYVNYVNYVNIIYKQDTLYCLSDDGSLYNIQITKHQRPPKITLNKCKYSLPYVINMVCDKNFLNLTLTTRSFEIMELDLSSNRIKIIENLAIRSIYLNSHYINNDGTIRSIYTDYNNSHMIQENIELNDTVTCYLFPYYLTIDKTIRKYKNLDNKTKLPKIQSAYHLLGKHYINWPNCMCSLYYILGV